MGMKKTPRFAPLPEVVETPEQKAIRDRVAAEYKAADHARWDAESHMEGAYAQFRQTPTHDLIAEASAAMGAYLEAKATADAKYKELKATIFG